MVWSAGTISGLDCKIVFLDAKILDIVIIHRFPRSITVMEEEYHYSLKHPSFALPSLRDLFSYRLHTDVCRKLAFASRGIYGGWEGVKEIPQSCLSLKTGANEGC